MVTRDEIKITLFFVVLCETDIAYIISVNFFYYFARLVNWHCRGRDSGLKEFKLSWRGLNLEGLLFVEPIVHFPQGMLIPIVHFTEASVISLEFRRFRRCRGIVE